MAEIRSRDILADPHPPKHVWAVRFGQEGAGFKRFTLGLKVLGPSVLRPLYIQPSAASKDIDSCPQTLRNRSIVLPLSFSLSHSCFQPLKPQRSSRKPQISHQWLQTV